MPAPVKTAIKNNTRPLMVAALLWTGMWVFMPPPKIGSGTLLVQSLLAVFLLACLTTACVLFSVLVRAHVARLNVSLAHIEPSPTFLKLFVVYKEGVKLVFGTSLTLAWLAGLLFIADKLGDHFLLVPVGAALGYSALIFIPTWLFTCVVDAIPYPGSQH